MVLLSGHGEQLAGERVCPPAAAKEMPGAEAESSPEQGVAEAAAEEPDEVEEEEDCEEYEDFSELPDTCSIASDDSFYPPGGLDDEDLWSLEGDERDSPEALSLFRACCTNNSIVLKALIRQGPQEEEVQEADRNRRVTALVGPSQAHSTTAWRGRAEPQQWLGGGQEAAKPRPKLGQFAAAGILLTSCPVPAVSLRQARIRWAPGVAPGRTRPLHRGPSAAAAGHKEGPSAAFDPSL
ncbi:ankyrin repeat domain-containing protein 33B-like [Parus major]|uniref:ankyrin repeat domain-containing protein 33B-like n=1 Tax=Parus major TaxID=9157 RepID=UPI001443C2CD|nr:ankyrin repeat domain-containing protein 33B-like [Parus major]